VIYLTILINLIILLLVTYIMDRNRTLFSDKKKKKVWSRFDL